MDETQAVTVVEAERVALTRMVDPPEAVLAEAQKAAKALQTVIAQKPRKIVFNDEQYLEFEDWQTLGRFYGVTVGMESEPELVDIGGTKGFKATAVAMLHGRVISRATAYCLNDEEKWGRRTKYEWAYVKKSGGYSVEDPGKDELIWEENPKKAGGKRPKKERIKVGEESVPLFQLASMSQTRACAKALRNVLSWVAVLAGYRPTPAEEMDGMVKAEAQNAEPPAGGAPICPHCKKGNIGTAQDGRAFCRDCGKGI
ncbi:MAG: hypothetical protein ACM33U_08650 [Solirubrobacterales bacterium]